MTDLPVIITRATFETANEQDDFWDLLNIYALDIMGGGKAIDASLKHSLIEQLRSRSGTFVFIAYVGEQSVGLINCFEGFSTFKAKPLLNIHDIVVIPEYRGRGIARLLLQEAENVARENGCCKLTLEVLEGNTTAQKAYRNFGFEGYELDPIMGKALFFEKLLG